MHTVESVLAHHGYSTTAIEFPELDVPVLTGNQRQGDVFILRVTTSHAGQPIGKGVTVVKAETNRANTHNLHGDGLWEAHPNAGSDNELVQGWVTVPEGGEVFLIHTEEHGANGMGPGTYEIRRQREFAGEWRKIAD